MTVQMVAFSTQNRFPVRVANAAIVIDVALDSDFLEETIVMDLGKGFGGEARR